MEISDQLDRPQRKSPGRHLCRLVRRTARASAAAVDAGHDAEEHCQLRRAAPLSLCYATSVAAAAAAAAPSADDGHDAAATIFGKFAQCCRTAVWRDSPPASDDSCFR
jgi:hypothetical protein